MKHRHIREHNKNDRPTRNQICLKLWRIPKTDRYLISIVGI